jgi:hypothetical protein
MRCREQLAATPCAFEAAVLDDGPIEAVALPRFARDATVGGSAEDGIALRVVVGFGPQSETGDLS